MPSWPCISAVVDTQTPVKGQESIVLQCTLDIPQFGEFSFSYNCKSWEVRGYGHASVITFCTQMSSRKFLEVIRVVGKADTVDHLTTTTCFPAAFWIWTWSLRSSTCWWVT